MSHCDTKYAYAVGRIRVLETRLLNKSNVDRMLGANNAEDAFKVLNDLDYASHSTDVSSPADFQDVINIGLQETKDLLEKIAPDPRILDLLWLRFDIHNIKTIIKAKVKELPEETLEDNVMRFGSLSHNLLQKYIFEGTHKEKLPETLKDAIDQALTLYEEHQNIQEVENYLENQFFTLTKDISKKSKDEFIKEYWRTMVDIKNIKAAIRAKKLGDSVRDINALFAEEGHVSIQTLLQYIGTENDAEAESLLTEGIKRTKYIDAVSHGLETYEKESSLLTLEIELDNFLVNYLKQAKRMVFGAGPLFAYFLAKKNNAQIIRAIMVGKLNKIEENRIRKLIRQLYV